MPQIRPITDLRNTTEISDLCYSKTEPIAEKQIADDQLLDGDEVFAKLRSKYGKEI